MILSEALDIEERQMFYGLRSKKGDFNGDTVFLTRTELLELVDYGINQMSDEEKKQLYKDHGFDNFQ